MSKRMALIAMFGWLAGVLGVTGSASAGTAFVFNANEQYRGYGHSPWVGTPGLLLETFEDGLLNRPGVTATNGLVKSSSASTRSVDMDDGQLNGQGTAGKTYTSGNKNYITFNFAPNAAGHRPSMAGLVWTNGHANSLVQLKAWDAYGALIGQITVKVGDLQGNNTVAHARFLGIKTDRGISKLQIVSNYAGFEIDHLQFVYGFAVVPVPPALALGAVGLAGVMVMRWRKRRHNTTSDKRPSC